MRIHFLGTGDAFCSGGRFQTCFKVEVPDYSFLVDCGATSLLAMNKNGVNSDSIDGIVVSHFHGDHFGGIPFLLLDANFNCHRTRPLEIAGPPGISTRVGELLEILYPGSAVKDLSYPVRFWEYKPGQSLSIGPLRVEAIPVIHVPESLPHGLRICHEHTTLSFSGDTGWTENLYTLANNAALFICECNFFSTDIPSHLNYQKLSAEKDNFQCKRFILNHLGKEMLSNLHQVQIESCSDGLVIDF